MGRVGRRSAAPLPSSISPPPLEAYDSVIVPGIIRAAALRIPGVRRRYNGVRSLAANFETLQHEHVRQVAAYADEIQQLMQALEHAYAVVEEERARGETATAERGSIRERVSKLSIRAATPAQVLCAITEPAPVNGRAYSVLLPAHLSAGDTSDESRRSRLQLLEDGVPLGPAHALHSDIAVEGGGRYSHWGDSLVFSASDSSDPRTNGRAYHVLLAPARGGVATSAGTAARVLRPIADFEAARGHMFTLRLPAGMPPGDIDGEPTRSRLEVLEDGVSIGPAHTPHSDIAEEGKGRYSHWEDGLLFSTSDNSDPRTNGREYHVLVPPVPRNATTASTQAKALHLLAYFEAHGGHMFSTRLPAGLPPGDANEDPGRSPLQILENGVPLGPSHAMHTAIAEEGKGRYSHWGDSLKFSASDNSDPRTNGREYHVLISEQDQNTSNIRRDHVAEGESEALKLQVYILRSDLNRSVARIGEVQSESLRASRDLQAAQARAEEADQCCAELKTRVAELEAAPEEAAAWRPELDQAYSRLLGATSLISADLKSLRQSLRADGPVVSGRGIELRQKYLDLLEGALTGCLYEDPPISPLPAPAYDPEVRQIGRDWPSLAQTMIGTVRMRNIRTLAEQVIEDGIAGDFLEAGVWRGGACIYMRGILDAHGDTERKVFVADSFAGLPEPDPDRYPVDAGDPHHTFKELAISLDDVKKNFAQYGLLDDRLVFLEGWFEDTLPGAPIEKLALLRLDGDMYSSTTQTLEALYGKLSTNGFIIIDDYILPTCRKAVDDFRVRMEITDPMQEIDGAGIYWRKIT